MARHADEVDVPEGKSLLDEGSTPAEFFAIEEGSVEVRRDAEVVAKLGPGDFFGETALIERGVRNATVTAAEPSTLMVMSPPAFRAMARRSPRWRRAPACGGECAAVVAES